VVNLRFVLKDLLIASRPILEEELKRADGHELLMRDEEKKPLSFNDVFLLHWQAAEKVRVHRLLKNAQMQGP
jgi:hypothetical protein